MHDSRIQKDHDYMYVTKNFTCTGPLLDRETREGSSSCQRFRNSLLKIYKNAYTYIVI